jgi:hypothetical protein
LLFRPALGAQFVGNLRELNKKARNPTAHGKTSEIDQDDVAGWMVDVAVLFEWARVAVPIWTDKEAARSDATKQPET